MNQTAKIEENRFIALDGLRGVAILMVMILHFYNEAIINNGYQLIGPSITKLALSGVYGNQLFFVISGFLITKILLDAKDKPYFFGNFYMRRFLRIVPLYYAALFILFFILPHMITFDEAAKDIAARQIWLWTFLSNYSWSGGKWDSSNLFRLGHFWFVCVLIHFYIIWPFVVYKFDARKLINICLLLIIILFFVRIIHTYSGGHPLFPWPINGLLWGSLLATGLRFESVSKFINRYSTQVAWTAGILLLMLIFVPRRNITGYYWTLTDIMSVLLFSGILIVVIRETGTASNLMKNKILITLGKYSYGMYVIHNICLPFFQWLFNPTVLADTLHSALTAQIIFYVLSMAASFILAFISWHLYEKHFIETGNSLKEKYLFRFTTT